MMLFHSGEDGNQGPAYRLPGDEIEFNRRNVFRPDQARDFAAGTCRSDDRRSAVVDPGLNRLRKFGSLWCGGVIRFSCGHGEGRLMRGADEQTGALFSYLSPE